MRAAAPRRWAWMAAGWACVVLGTVGIVVPGLPTTGFFVAAASCFARSSPRFERWVLGLPRVGPMVRDYRAGYGMPRRAKVVAVAMMLAAAALSVLTLSWAPARVAVVAAVLVGCWFVLRRVPTRESVLAAGG